MAESLSDAILLERFASGREEAAFVALVRRHGPRVERICRRILRNEQDVEDVFQATFLVLARRAGGIAWRDSASPWIDGVARRLALHTRSGAARRSGRERTVTNLTCEPNSHDGRLPERYHPVVDSSAEIERRDLRRVLDDELLRLPEKYRAPVVLCDLEGHTREEAARRLGWPTGSMSRRLDRARTLLRRRLTYRGVALAVVGIASIAIAAAGLGRRTDRALPSSSVRQVMAPFQTESEGGRGFGSILAAAARSPGDRPDFPRILPAARQAVAAARHIRDLASGPLGNLWNQYATDMERSASDLELACRDSDAPAVIAAAQRLDTSCMSCHAVFRPEATYGAPASRSFPRPAAERSGALPPASGSERSPRRSGAERSPLPTANEWVRASVKIDEPLCSVMAYDRRARPMRLA
jgi:RNA polymerase sigma-70 factor (ECF subfamily)